MRTNWLVLSLAGAALLLCACEDKKPTRKADDELTIVVEADKTRIAAQEAALAEQRKSVEAEKDRLRAQMDKLDQAKGEKPDDAQTQDLAKQMMKLMRAQEDMAAKRDALDKERNGLLQKVIGEPGTRAAVAAQAVAAPAVVAPAVDLAKVTGQVAAREGLIASREKSIAEREASLAEREKSLASREAALATRDSACASAAAARPAAGGAGLNRAAVEKAYRALLALMDSKGVLASDLPAGKQKALKDAANFQKGDLAQAMAAVDQVEAAVNAIAVDGPFVSEKAKRVDALQRSSKNARAKEEVNRLLQEMARAYSDGHYHDANRALNNIVHLLQKGPEKAEKADKTDKPPDQPEKQP